MTVTHHLSDELILAYGTGELDEATSLLVATHLALCPQCRAELETTETLAGAMFETLPGAPIDDGMLDALMKRIDQTDPAPIMTLTRHPDPEAVRSFVLPQPLRDYVGGDVDEIRWRAVGGGVSQLPINTGEGGAKALLLNIAPEAKVPEHGHRGLELTLVLSGSFVDDGDWLHRGDVEEADASVEHQPIAGPDEACICLAVTDAPLRFRSLIPRLAQPFLGI